MIGMKVGEKVYKASFGKRFSEIKVVNNNVCICHDPCH
jgi:hypothetical protein